MISLITPNYNGEAYLEDCLGSIASQTQNQDDVEMILVDDGSTDGSRDIIESYQNHIPGLKPLWHEHTGRPGMLRNIAIQRATGRYVLFLDSDDFLGNESIERLSSFSDETNADVIAFQLQGLNRSVPSSMLRQTNPNADLIASGLYKTLGIWKMCRRDFLQQSLIRFDPSIGRGDDVVFFAEAMLRAKKFAILGGYPFYTLRGRDDDSSITQKEWNHEERISVAKRVGELTRKFAASDVIAAHFYIRLFNADALSIINSPTTSSHTLERLRNTLQPYWTEEVARLIYTGTSRRQLIDFFGEPHDNELS